MVGLFGYVAGGAMEGLGTGIVAEAQAKREEMLEALAQDRLDRRQQMVNDAAMQRLERTAELESGARREAAKLNSQTAIATEERDRRNADRDFQRERQTRAKIGTPVEPTERARTTLDIFKALDPGRNRNDLAGLLGGDVSDMPDTANMSVEERWAMAERLTERLYPSGRGPARRGEERAGPSAADNAEAAPSPGSVSNEPPRDGQRMMARVRETGEEMEVEWNENLGQWLPVPNAGSSANRFRPAPEDDRAPLVRRRERRGEQTDETVPPRERGLRPDGRGREAVTIDEVERGLRRGNEALGEIGVESRRPDRPRTRLAPVPGSDAQRFRPAPAPREEVDITEFGNDRQRSGSPLLTDDERSDMSAAERVRAATRRAMGQDDIPSQDDRASSRRQTIAMEIEAVEEDIANLEARLRRGTVTQQYYDRNIARLRRELGRLEREQL